MKKHHFVISIIFLAIAKLNFYAANHQSKAGKIYYQKEKYKPGSKKKKRVIKKVVKNIDQLFSQQETSKKEVLEIDFFTHYKYKNPKHITPYPTPFMTCSVIGSDKLYAITSSYEAENSNYPDYWDILRDTLNNITEKFVMIAKKIKEGHDITIPYPTEKHTIERFLFWKNKAPEYHDKDGNQNIFSRLGKMDQKDMSLFIQKHVFYLHSFASCFCVINYYDHENPTNFFQDHQETDRVKKAYSQYLSAGGLRLKEERKILVPQLQSDDELPKLLPEYSSKKILTCPKIKERSKETSSNVGNNKIIISQDASSNQIKKITSTAPPSQSAPIHINIVPLPKKKSTSSEIQNISSNTTHSSVATNTNIPQKDSLSSKLIQENPSSNTTSTSPASDTNSSIALWEDTQTPTQIQNTTSNNTTSESPATNTSLDIIPEKEDSTASEIPKFTSSKSKNTSAPPSKSMDFQDLLVKSNDTKEDSSQNATQEEIPNLPTQPLGVLGSNPKFINQEIIPENLNESPTRLDLTESKSNAPNRTSKKSLNSPAAAPQDQDLLRQNVESSYLIPKPYPNQVNISAGNPKIKSITPKHKTYRLSNWLLLGGATLGASYLLGKKVLTKKTSIISQGTQSDAKEK